MKLIRNKSRVLRGSMTLRMIELGFAITLFDLAAALLPEIGARLPVDSLWLISGAAVFQFLAWIGRFVLQPKLTGDADAGE